MYLIDFNECQENNKAYGGMAGSKLGIIYQGEDWILKFPKSTKGMRKTEISYTTSPLSEYIGSHIYQILGYPVHETKLTNWLLHVKILRIHMFDYRNSEKSKTITIKNWRQFWKIQ